MPSASALHWAVSAGETNCIVYLVERAGAAIDATTQRDDDHLTALHIAAIRGTCACVRAAAALAG